MFATGVDDLRNCPGGFHVWVDWTLVIDAVRTLKAVLFLVAGSWLPNFQTAGTAYIGNEPAEAS